MAAGRRKHAPPYARKGRSGALRIAEPTAADWLLDQRLERLIATLGNNGVADLLGVSPSQPSRWRSGAERIGATSQRALLDLDYVMTRLLQLFPPRQAEIWLSSPNGHLGARPIDVLRVRGASSVIQAIDAEAEDAYA